MTSFIQRSCTCEQCGALYKRDVACAYCSMACKEAAEVRKALHNPVARHSIELVQNYDAYRRAIVYIIRVRSTGIEIARRYFSEDMNALTLRREVGYWTAELVDEGKIC